MMSDRYQVWTWTGSKRGGWFPTLSPMSQGDALAYIEDHERSCKACGATPYIMEIVPVVQEANSA